MIFLKYNVGFINVNTRVLFTENTTVVQRQPQLHKKLELNMQETADGVFISPISEVTSLLDCPL